MNDNNVLKEAARQQAIHAANLEDLGHELKTTFYQDLTVAELLGGPDAIRDTYNRVNEAWRNNAAYYSEFILALNHKIWQHHKTNPELADLYNELWREADEWAAANYKGEDAQTYFNITD